MKRLMVTAVMVTVVLMICAIAGPAGAGGDGGLRPGRERRLARGIVDRIGARGALEFTAENAGSLRQPAEVLDHGDAVVRAIGWLGSTGLLEPEGIEAVGHRIVHGGDRFLRREARRRNDSDGKPGPWQDKKGAYGQRLRLGSPPCSLPCSSGA